MSKFYDLARMTTATTGGGTITLGSAVSSFLSFSGAGVSDQDTITYAIEDGANREIGHGVYSSSGTTLTRNVLKSTNSDAAINLSGTAQVFITLAAEDFTAAAGAASAALATPSKRQSAFTRTGSVTSASVTLGSDPMFGNMLVAFTHGDTGGGGWTPPAGWTTQLAYSPTSQEYKVYTKIADGTEGTTITFTNSGASKVNLSVMEWVNVGSVVASDGTCYVGGGTFAYAGSAIWPPPFTANSPTIALSLIGNVNIGNAGTPARANGGGSIIKDYSSMDSVAFGAVLLQSVAFSNALDIFTPTAIFGMTLLAANYMTLLLVGGVNSTSLSTSTDVDLSTAPTDGQGLAWKSSTSKWTPKSFLSAIPALSVLPDVNVTEGAGIDGYGIKWDQATSKWIAAALTTTTLAGLTDVDMSTGPTSGQALVWDNGASKWKPGTVGGGGGGGATYTHYRLILFGYNTPYLALALTELWVQDGTGSPKTPTASAATGTGAGAVANLYDSSTSTDWESAAGTEVSTIDFTYAIAFTAGFVSFTTRNDGYYRQFPSVVVVLGSNDGTTYVKLGSCYLPDPTSAAQTIVAPIL